MDTEQRVIRTVAQQFGLSDEEAATKTKTDWGMDSLDEIELVMAVEDEFGIDIPDEHAAKWQSAADIVRYVNERQAA